MGTKQGKESLSYTLMGVALDAIKDAVEMYGMVKCKEDISSKAGCKAQSHLLWTAVMPLICSYYSNYRIHERFRHTTAELCSNLKSLMGVLEKKPELFDDAKWTSMDKTYKVVLLQFPITVGDTRWPEGIAQYPLAKEDGTQDKLRQVFRDGWKAYTMNFGRWAIAHLQNFIVFVFNS